MAVDPLTAKILAKVAVQAATDSESRKRILFMILAPVLGLYYVNDKGKQLQILDAELA